MILTQRKLNLFLKTEPNPFMASPGQLQGSPAFNSTPGFLNSQSGHSKKAQATHVNVKG
jgi:hypothetical protein